MTLVFSILQSSQIQVVTDCTNKGTTFTNALRRKTSLVSGFSFFTSCSFWMVCPADNILQISNFNVTKWVTSTQANPYKSKEWKIIWLEEIAVFHTLQKGKLPACNIVRYRLNSQVLHIVCLNSSKNILDCEEQPPPWSAMSLESKGVAYSCK